MRKWDQEQDKPAVKAVIDRRQLLLGTVTLLAMAALLIVGLTPRSADAPDAGPDAAQAGSDAAALLLETCQVVQHMTFTPCGTRADPPADPAHRAGGQGPRGRSRRPTTSGR